MTSFVDREELLAEYDHAIEQTLKAAWSLLQAVDSGDSAWEYGAKTVLRARLRQIEHLRRAKAVAA